MTRDFETISTAQTIKYKNAFVFTIVLPFVNKEDFK